MFKNILLTIAYDGSGFSGWQRQPNARTVCGELEALLSDICGALVQLNGCSRTDAGVHAKGQRASFISDCPVPAERLARVMNDRLAKDRLEGVGEIRILEAKEMPEDFHARFDSRGKRYVYRIRAGWGEAGSGPDVFSRNYCYQVREKLDAEAMKKAASYIIGTHDFKCFEAAGSTPRESTVRTSYSLEIDCSPAQNSGPATGAALQDITVRIEGDGFLYNMVRIITGTLVEVGQRKRSPESIKDTIASLDRSRAGHTAPPQGLYLDEIFYQ
jgi:tRNA pseudouridine38-40 synthase